MVHDILCFLSMGAENILETSTATLVGLLTLEGILLAGRSVCPVRVSDLKFLPGLTSLLLCSRYGSGLARKNVIGRLQTTIRNCREL
jgi:hypothetical protein